MIRTTATIDAPFIPPAVILRDVEGEMADFMRANAACTTEMLAEEFSADEIAEHAEAARARARSAWTRHLA